MLTAKATGVSHGCGSASAPGQVPHYAAGEPVGMLGENIGGVGFVGLARAGGCQLGSWVPVDRRAAQLTLPTSLVERSLTWLL